MEPVFPEPAFHMVKRGFLRECRLSLADLDRYSKSKDEAIGMRFPMTGLFMPKGHRHMQNINTFQNIPQEKKSPCFTGLTGPEAIRLILGHKGLRQEDIAPIIGSSGATSEILSGKRTISKPIAKRLNRWLGIPVHVLRRCGA